MIKDYLTAPLWWNLEQYTYVFSPYLPEEHTESYFTEIPYRALLLLISLPITVVATISLMGAFIASWCETPPPFRHIVNPHISTEDTKKTMRVFTANICGMPGPLPGFFGGMKPLHLRLDQLADKILSQNADVVCLQEALDPLTIQRLVKKFESSYAHVIYHVDEPSNPFKIGSGLLVASKIKIEKIAHTRFPTPNGIQGSVNKGFLVLDLANKVRIIPTHLHPGETPEDEAVRDQQLGLLKPFVNQNALLIGDLNDDRSKGRITAHFEDPIQRPFPDTFTDAFNDYRQGRPMQKGQEGSIDYIVKAKQSTLKFTHVEVVPFYDMANPHNNLSDHNGLLMTIAT